MNTYIKCKLIQIEFDVLLLEYHEDQWMVSILREFSNVLATSQQLKLFPLAIDCDRH